MRNEQNSYNIASPIIQLYIIMFFVYFDAKLNGINVNVNIYFLFFCPIFNF